MIVGGIVELAEGKSGVGTMFLRILLGVAIVACGIGLYLYVAKKCPDALKKGLLKSMVIVGLGVSMKIALFFVKGIWSYTASGSSAGQEIPSLVCDPDTGETFSVTTNGNSDPMIDRNGDTQVLHGDGGAFHDSNGNHYVV